jgi:hypothetical protein
LREVELLSLRIAEEREDRSFRISAGWLSRVERQEHELTVNKLMALAYIYNVRPEQLLPPKHPGNPESIPLRQVSNPDAMILLTEGSMEEHSSYPLPRTPGPDELPEETVLLSTEAGSLPAPYRWGIIGKSDLTLDPMIPPGSIVQIDTQKRAISSRKDPTHKFQRSIYFLQTREGYVCGWCELDGNSEWLTVIPHPLSLAYTRRWRYGGEVEIIGRVVLLAVRLTQ